MSSSLAATRARERRPWLTYGLVALCAIGFLHEIQRDRELRASADIALDKAAAYWTERPYLEPAESVVDKLTAEFVQNRRSEYQRDRYGRGSIGVPEPLRSQYQEVLDGLTADALEPLLLLPSHRLGVRVSRPRGVSYLTHLFLHDGWLHLIGNVVLLLVLGAFVERAWGHALFGVAVLILGVAAASAFRIQNSELEASLIGTTGLLAGLLSAFALRFAARWSEPSYGPVLLGGACWLALSVGLGWDGSVVPSPTAGRAAAEAAGSAFWAIAGGFGGGIAVAALVMVARIESLLFEEAPAPAAQPSLDPDLAAALEARDDGRLAEAFDRIEALLRRSPEHRAALLAMWEVALDLGRSAEASNAMLRVLRDEVRRNVPSAVEHWLELSSRGLHGGAEPALLIHVALMLSEAGRRSEALGALSRALEISAQSGKPELAARVARASRSLDRGFTEAAAWTALGSAQLSFQDRQNLETLLGDLQREAPAARADDTPRHPVGADASAASSRARSGSAPRADARAQQWDFPDLDGHAEPDCDEALVAVDSSRARESAAEPVAAARAAPIDLEISSRSIRVVSAQPIELAEDGLLIEIQGGEKRKIGFERVDALSVVAVDGLGSKFVIVIDLVLNWMSEPSEPLRVIRLRGDRFDPRQFAPDLDSPLDAMRAFTARLLNRSNAVALPDIRSVRGTPFASFSDLAAYQRTVMSVEEDGIEADPIA